MADGERSGERGFTLLETLLTALLSVIVMVGVAEAVLQAMHASQRTLVRAALADDAMNVLSDVRMTTAYDQDALASLVGKTSRSKLAVNGRNITVVIAVTQATASPTSTAAPVIAHVTVADADGETLTEDQVLYHEAPIPGSVVDETAPGNPPAGGP